jgi:putative ABC transport system ATP-binding protein
MNPNLFRYIWQHTRRDQLWIIAVILVSMPFLFMALDLPKLIVNGPIQGRSFTTPDATARFMELKFALPAWLGGGRLDLFNGIELGRMAYLVALSLVFLMLVCINGLFKYYINTFKGRLGERMLRRLRYDLVDRVLRFPMAHFKKVKSAEIATMVKDEVEPLGGFIGDAFVQPVFLSGQALTALIFIMVQSLWLGLIAASIVLVQAFLIPKLRRRLLVLGKQQQLTARDLAGRVSEVVEGIGEARTNDTSNYERADISHRLGRIFFIRYELYQRKFFVKFLNNFLAQLTPFLFFLVGGYFAIRGSLDIGQLVAVIAAYKDLPGPIKELIDWDQQRQDVQIKYGQVSEQFSPEPMLAAVLQAPTPGPVPRIDQPIEIKGMSITDDTGAKVLEASDLTLAPGEWVAAVGEVNAGAEATAEALAGLVAPTSGRIRIGDQQLDAISEAVTGRRIAYVGPDTFLRNSSIRDCLLYGLMNYPHGPVAQGPGHALTHAEARASGNSELDCDADWIDYDRIGLADRADLDRQVLTALAAVELDDDIFEFGLRSSPDIKDDGTFETRILEARAALKAKLAAASIAHMVEPFDPERYQVQATIAENLVFGAALDASYRAENLPANRIVLAILAENGLDQQLWNVGRRIAATVVELFADLPPDHPFFDRLSFVKPDELPNYKSMLARIGERNITAADKADRAMILGLALGYIEPRHRLSLLSDDIRALVVDARRRLNEKLGRDHSTAVAVYEPEHYNAGSSLEANILFGRITHGLADAASKVGLAMRETLAELGLRDTVVQAGLRFMVGPGGKRLSQTQRQKIALARALLKRPDVLIVNRGLGNLNARNQRSIMSALAKTGRAKDKSSRPAVFWVLASPALVDLFDRVVVFRDGRITGDGAPARMLQNDQHLKRLVA